MLILYHKQGYCFIDLDLPPCYRICIKLGLSQLQILQTEQSEDIQQTVEDIQAAQ